MGNCKGGAPLTLKGVLLVTSVLGLTGLWPAILADTGATVLVTMNALRLLRFDPSRSDPGTLRSEDVKSPGVALPAE